MSVHSAADSASGYLYQCRYALLAALGRQAVSPALQISIETFDDIAFLESGEPIELIQTKHSLSAKNIGDMAGQFWNTIGIWIKRVTDHPSELGKVKLVFLTTATLPAGSGIILLRPGEKERDVKAAAEKLEAAALKSKNADSAWARELFLKQTPELREQILDMVEALDASPNIIDARENIATELRRACGPEHLTAFVERLEGWWFTVVIGALATKGGKLIPVSMLDSKVDDLREEFGPARLPIDYGAVDPSVSTVILLEARPFVEQLKLIRVGPTGQKMAIVDFFRARQQRSRWARDGLLRVNELTDYGRALADNWSRRKGLIEGKVKPDTAPDELVSLGQSLYADTTAACVPLREVTEPFISHGTYHILADRQEIGWHPHYDQHLSGSVTPEDDNDAPME
jgi:hypothetical protein